MDKSRAERTSGRNKCNESTVNLEWNSKHHGLITMEAALCISYLRHVERQSQGKIKCTGFCRSFSSNAEKKKKTEQLISIRISDKP